MVNQPKKPLLNAKQVATWLGFEPRTITNWAVKYLDSGGVEGLPGYKLDDEWRFDEDEVSSWLQKKRGLQLPHSRPKQAAQG